jgi:glycosyltransferase involved in cell wall biosynthesis
MTISEPLAAVQADSAQNEGIKAGRLPVSVVILTLNEEANIEDCLQSVCEWAGEIFVVDSGSHDRTVEIARRFTERVVLHPFENYSSQRNWAQQNLPLTNEWIFHIDADERVTPELAESFQKLFTSGSPGDADGFLISRRTIFMGRAIMHGGHYPAYHLRLFRRHKGRCEDRLYDQHFILDGPVRTIPGDLIDVITSDLTVWLIRHARWGAAEAHEMSVSADSGDNRLIGRPSGTPIERRRWLRSSIYGKAPLFLRAFAYFFYRYFLRLGFLDGREGLIFHFLQGCFFRFYVDAKIYEMRKGMNRSTISNAQCPMPNAQRNPKDQ